jgi:hypothetical protein
MNGLMPLMCLSASSGVFAALMPLSLTTSSMSASHTTRPPKFTATVAPLFTIIFSRRMPATGALAPNRS